MKKALKIFTYILCTLLALIADGSAKSYTMKIGYACRNDTQDFTGIKFKELVEKATGKHLKVQLYPGSQLGSNQKVVDSVQTGTIQATLQPTAFLGGFSPLLTTADLPYLWPDQATMLDILNYSEIGEKFAKSIENKGVSIIGFFNQGTKQIVANVEVKTVEDMAGKKFRVMGAPVLADMMSFWGAAAVPLPFNGIYTALQQKTVEGIEQTVELTFLFKYFEAAPNITITNHGELPSILMVNSKWIKDLPDDIQKAIKDSFLSASKESAAYSIKANKDALIEMEKSSKVQVIRPSKESLEAFKTTALPLYDKFKSDVPEAKFYIDGFSAMIKERSKQKD